MVDTKLLSGHNAEQHNKGRKTIDKRNEGRISLRAAKGKLDTNYEKCPECHHHKSLENSTYVKCSRCGRIHRWL